MEHKCFAVDTNGKCGCLTVRKCIGSKCAFYKSIDTAIADLKSAIRYNKKHKVLYNGDGNERLLEKLKKKKEDTKNE